MKTIRVGVVGVGHLGRHHARIYTELIGAQLLGVVDSNLSQAQAVAEGLGVPAYSDLDRFIQEQQPEAMSVVVPTSAHFDVARRLAERGIHMLVEKPVTTTVEQAAALAELAKAKNIVLQVGHVERFNSAVRYLSQQMSDDILCIQSRRQGPFSPRIADVGVVLDLMIHDIDIVLSLVKSEITAIHAMGRSVRTNREDFAVAQIAFASGAVADIHVSRVAERRARQMDITLPDRYVSVNFETQDVAVYRSTAAPAS
ncbi:MAG: Gfo/Idh/MocA family oxidoreductase, partial [Pyramidobacter sp.]|nr:Gfo/Idh/MocA family oxidoreductase [Pyramidobacter sp.]